MMIVPAKIIRYLAKPQFISSEQSHVSWGPQIFGSVSILSSLSAEEHSSQFLKLIRFLQKLKLIIIQGPPRKYTQCIANISPHIGAPSGSYGLQKIPQKQRPYAICRTGTKVSPPLINPDMSWFIYNVGHYCYVGENLFSINDGQLERVLTEFPVQEGHLIKVSDLNNLLYNYR